MDSTRYSARPEPVLARHARMVWLVSTLAIAAAIALLTLTPTPHVPRGDFHWDKLAHMLAFLALVFPTAALWPRVTAWIGLLAVAYGGVIEAVQPFAGRSAEVADLVADGIGVGLGIILGITARRVYRTHRAMRAR